MSLKTDYKDYIPPASGKKYTITTDSLGFSTIQDSTDYSQVGDTFGASDINATNIEVNSIVSQKGAANGLATLDANSRVVQSPASAGQANGLATLNASGKVSQPLASAENLTSQVTIASNVNFSKPVIYRIGNLVFIYYYFSWTGATVGQYNNALSGLPAPSPSTNYYFVDYKDTTVDIQIASNGTMNFNPKAASGSNCYGMLFYPC